MHVQPGATLCSRIFLVRKESYMTNCLSSVCLEMKELVLPVQTDEVLK